TAPAPPPATRPARRPASRESSPPRRIGRLAALTLLALCFVLTARDAVTLALTRDSRLDPDLRQAYAWLARATPPGAVVLAPWQFGYEIQTLAGRRTVVDGLLEDPLTHDRIVAVARAWLAADTDSLAALCDQAGAGFLLVPPSSAIYDQARLTDWPAAWKTRAGVALNREEADRVLVRMSVLGESPPPFERVFASGRWSVYRRVRASRAGA
ncbi:MAG TPA: hypothetical protein VJY35_07945, partial [Candidatus Eisenbacteria bacterium]|nr:hypothetical protein [Candidatus Eisenbacteria bacterium]